MAFNTSPSSEARWRLKILTHPYSSLPSCHPQTLPSTLHLSQQNTTRKHPTSVLNTHSASSAQRSCRGRFQWALELLRWVHPLSSAGELALSLQLGIAPALTAASAFCSKYLTAAWGQSIIRAALHLGTKQPLPLLMCLYPIEIKSRGWGNRGNKAVSLHLSLNTYRLNSSGETSGPCFGLIR